jgi:hypothetical protein
MTRLKRLAFAALLAACTASPARSDDAADFMQRFSGVWLGAGQLLIGDEEDGLKFQCELDGAPSRTQLTFSMTGRCSMAGLSASIYGSLRYNAHTNEFYGDFLGGSEGDGLDVVAARAGDGFSMRLTRGGVQGRLTAEAINPDQLEVVIYYRDWQRDREIPVIGINFTRNKAAEAERSRRGRNDVTGSIDSYD